MPDDENSYSTQPDPSYHYDAFSEEFRHQYKKHHPYRYFFYTIFNFIHHRWLKLLLDRSEKSINFELLHISKRKECFASLLMNWHRYQPHPKLWNTFKQQVLKFIIENNPSASLNLEHLDKLLFRLCHKNNKLTRDQLITLFLDDRQLPTRTILLDKYPTQAYHIVTEMLTSQHEPSQGSSLDLQLLRNLLKKNTHKTTDPDLQKIFESINPILQALKFRLYLSISVLQPGTCAREELATTDALLASGGVDSISHANRLILEKSLDQQHAKTKELIFSLSTYAQPIALPILQELSQHIASSVEKQHWLSRYGTFWLYHLLTYMEIKKDPNIDILTKLSRKNLLKTQDLMDIFQPEAPEAPPKPTSSEKTKSKKEESRPKPIDFHLIENSLLIGKKLSALKELYDLNLQKGSTAFGSYITQVAKATNIADLQKKKDTYKNLLCEVGNASDIKPFEPNRRQPTPRIRKQSELSSGSPHPPAAEFFENQSEIDRRGVPPDQQLRYNP